MNLVNNKEILDKEKDIAIQQYVAYIESVDKNSDRRININNFYITLNSAIFTIATIFVNNFKISIVLYLLGMIFAIIWFLNLKNYKNLSSCKFHIINEMEEHMPFNLFKYEWYKLDEGKNNKKYIPVTKFEYIIPIIFSVMFITLIIIEIMSKIDIVIMIK